MRRIGLIIEYDGTDFAGWQRQKNLKTVQGEIEKNLLKITREEITIHASGRTDRGVHALGQMAHFDTNSRIPSEKFTFALNVGLPESIRIRQSFEVPADFHSRFSAKKKHYRYTIENTDIPSALYRNIHAHVYRKFNVSDMQQAAKILIGEHDFASFTTAECPIETTVRTIFESKVTTNEHLLYYDVVGSGFLYKMVRVIVGTLIEIGEGIRPVDDMHYFLDNPDRMRRKGATAQAKGLTLIDVDYGDALVV